MFDFQKSLQQMISSRVFTIILLLAICLVGFYIRFDNLYTWLGNKNSFFTSSGLPVTLGADPYYYLDIARDLLAGKIIKFDQLRNFPDGGVRPSAAPLLSVLLAAATFLGRQPLEWVAVLIPPFLGILLAIPVYFLGVVLTLDAAIPFSRARRVDLSEAKFTGALAALFALLSPPLVIRSSIGWCDTDILNVTFSVACLVPALGFAVANSQGAARKYFLVWLVLLLAFAWWWDQALTPVLFLGGAPMLLALWQARDRFSRRQKLYALPALIFLLLLFAWKGEGLPAFQKLFSYVFGTDSSPVFPAFEGLVDEQVNRSFWEIATDIGGNPFLYFGSLVGLVLLPFLAGRKTLFLFPLLVVNALALQGMRFMIFAAPIFSLGLATLFLVVILLLRKIYQFRFLLVVLLALILARSPLAASQAYNGGRPVLMPGVYEGMQVLAGSAPARSTSLNGWAGAGLGLGGRDAEELLDGRRQRGLVVLGAWPSPGLLCRQEND